MNTVLLLQKLIAIERAIGFESPQTLRLMVIDVEDYVLGIQNKAIDRLCTEPRPVHDPLPN